MVHCILCISLVIKRNQLLRCVSKMCIFGIKNHNLPRLKFTNKISKYKWRIKTAVEEYYKHITMVSIIWNLEVKYVLSTSTKINFTLKNITCAAVKGKPTMYIITTSTILLVILFPTLAWTVTTLAWQSLACLLASLGSFCYLVWPILDQWDQQGVGLDLP